MFTSDEFDWLVREARFLAHYQAPFSGFFLLAREVLAFRYTHFFLTQEELHSLFHIYEVASILARNWRDPHVLLLSPPQLAPFVSTPRKAGPFFRAWNVATQESSIFDVTFSQWNEGYLGTCVGVAS